MQSTEKWFLTDTKMGASTNISKASNAAIEAGIRYHRKMYKLFAVQLAVAMPDWKLMIEPWFKSESQRLRSPDSVLLGPEATIVIEVKKNWADGRDTKLLDEYLPICKNVWGKPAFPLMVVGNVRGLKHEAITNLSLALAAAQQWRPGTPTPTLLKL